MKLWCKLRQAGVWGLLENALSLRTSAHAGVAIPRIFKHLGRKTKLFPSNRGGLPHQ